MFCGSSSWCRGLVCSMWLRYFLIILTYFCIWILQLTRKVLKAEEERGGCFSLIVFLQSCDSLCSVSSFLWQVPWIGLCFVNVAFPGHTHFLILLHLGLKLLISLFFFSKNRYPTSTKLVYNSHFWRKVGDIIHRRKFDSFCPIRTL